MDIMSRCRLSARSVLVPQLYPRRNAFRVSLSTVPGINKRRDVRMGVGREGIKRGESPPFFSSSLSLSSPTLSHLPSSLPDDGRPRLRHLHPLANVDICVDVDVDVDDDDAKCEPSAQLGMGSHVPPRRSLLMLFGFVQGVRRACC